MINTFVLFMMLFVRVSPLLCFFAAGIAFQSPKEHLTARDKVVYCGLIVLLVAMGLVLNEKV